MKYDLVIIGGGAAGFFAAVNVSEIDKNVRILIVEKDNSVLSKVRVSGGGHCNITNSCIDPKEFFKNYPRGNKEFLSALYRFGSKDTVTWFEKRGVLLKARLDGKVFPVTNDSETVIDCLKSFAEENNVEIKLNSFVTAIKRLDNDFLVVLKDNESIEAKKILVTTGGSSKKKAYEFIEELGINIIQPVPSLFTFNLPNNPILKLMGVSVNDCTIKIVGQKKKIRDSIIITHWGMSGPAILKMSAFFAPLLFSLNYSFSFSIDWVPDLSQEDILILLKKHRADFGSKKVSNTVIEGVPKRLLKFFIKRVGLKDDVLWANVPKSEFNRLIETLKVDRYKAEGKSIFKDEFVTAGGVSRKEVDFKTMESKSVPGLFFAGEVIDIDGLTGGFNLQAAWTTGFIASMGILYKGF